MKRTIVYIDGNNLYYGMLKGTPFKWLDLSDEIPVEKHKQDIRRPDAWKPMVSAT